MPETGTDRIAALLAQHRTHLSIMGGWSIRNGKDSERRFGWSCSCGEHSPDSFRVDLTETEADAGRFAHVAALVAERLTTPEASSAPPPYICRHGKTEFEHWCDDLADHDRSLTFPPGSERGGERP